MKLNENSYYHIYHRAIEGSYLFWTNEDYERFLSRYYFYMYFSTDTIAYCLLRNHVHFLVRIRSLEEQKSIFGDISSQFPIGTFHGDDYEYQKFKVQSASTQFGHLMNSHTKTINSMRNRSGVLLDGRFKRKEISDVLYLLYLTGYIHRNPIHHRIVEKFCTYPYSSYNLILSDQTTLLNRKYALEIFGGVENFIEAHEELMGKLGNDFLFE